MNKVKSLTQGAIKVHLCPACNMCVDPTPVFCALLYNHNSERFFDVFSYFYLRSQPITFLHFIGAVCNSKGVCPVKSDKCNELRLALGCYESFLSQGKENLPVTFKELLYSNYSDLGTDTQAMGRLNMIPDDIRNYGRKKDRRKLKKMFKAVQKDITHGHDKKHIRGIFNSVRTTGYSKSTPKKKIQTTMIFNTEEGSEWEDTIKSYLET